MTVPPTLEPPSSEALQRSGRLLDVIHDELRRASGWLSFSRFMELALYDPAFGYYTSGSTQLGASGDFTTAPETSALFGRAIARQVAQILAHGAPCITEFGPGSGALAAELLLSLERLGQLPQSYALVDVSGALRERQRLTLDQRVPHLVSRCTWYERWPERLEGVVLGNEVLDALPADLIAWHDGTWNQRGIVAAPNPARIAFQDRPVTGDLAASIAATLPPEVPWPEGYVTEISRHGQALVATLAARLHAGVVLLIDYGFPAHEFYHRQRASGTLMAHYRHRAHAEVLLWPGLQDLTTHVDFSAVARAARDAGCRVLGYTSQARFLLNCGILELIETPADDAARWLPEANALGRLLSEAEMGELFKVIAWGRGTDLSLIGFASGDRSARL